MSERMLTELATAAGGGDHRAADELFAALYAELRETAANLLKRQNSGHTLQATALVHEAYMKLVDPGRMSPQGTAHFRALAAKAMRQILIDHARAKGRKKRGGQGSWRRVGLTDVLDYGSPPGPAVGGDPDLGIDEADLLNLHETLNEMKRLDERLSQVVEMRLLGGLTTAETAEVLGISTRSVERDWALGKAWLRKNLSGE